MFKMEIKTGGAAFRDEDGNLDETGYEVRRQLKSISEKIKDGYTGGVLIDTNGNKVGSWRYDD
jgi:hypothetical protein